MGCGRYDAAHAFVHYQQSSHCFAMDLSTQRVWDYARDGYVHRIAQNKSDGKLVELPPTPTTHPHPSSLLQDNFDEYVPREKLDKIGREYTHLLTSQLDSQRMYFEEILERATDKKVEATRVAEKATEATALATQQLSALQVSHDALMNDRLPALERQCERAAKRADKFEGMARKLEQEWRGEKAMAGNLLDRVKSLSDEMETLRAEKTELEEQNRDLSFFISGGAKLKTVAEGMEEEIREGTVSVPPGVPEGKTRKKGGKGKR